jgi:hypothetical protein
VEFESPDPAAASPTGSELVDLDDGGGGEAVGGQPRDPGGHVALAHRVERHVPEVGEHMHSLPGLVPDPRCRPQEQRGPPLGMPVPEPGPACLGSTQVPLNLAASTLVKYFCASARRVSS